MKEPDILLSIILPVYNAGPYLARCLDSLVGQTLKSLELIAVLDCPTDGSGGVLKAYAEKNHQIIVVENSHNMHIGESRNVGLGRARGKYIGFCDHDDICSYDMFEKLLYMMESARADLVLSNYVRMEGKNMIDRHTYPSLADDERASVFFQNMVGPLSKDDWEYMVNGVVWNKLFRRDIIEANKIRFVDTRNMVPEDVIFLIEYSRFCKRIAYCDEDLYHHFAGVGNTAATWEYNDIAKVIKGLEHTNSFLAAEGLREELGERFFSSVRYRYLSSLNYILKRCRFGLIKQMLALLVREPLVRDSFRMYRMVVYMPWKGRCMAVLLKLCVLVFSWRFQESAAAEP